MASDPMELSANAQLDVTHVYACGAWADGVLRVDDDGVSFRARDAEDATALPWATIHRVKHSKPLAGPYDVVLERDGDERLVWALRVSDGVKLLGALRERGVAVDP